MLESTRQNGLERKANDISKVDDVSKVDKLLHDYVGINPTISNTICLGKSSIDLDYSKLLLQQSKKNLPFCEIVIS